MQKIIRNATIFVLTLMLSVCAFGCTTDAPSTPGDGGGEKPSKPGYTYGAYESLEKVASFDGLLEADKWSATVERYTVIENGIMTLHPGTTQATLEDANFESGTFELKLKTNPKGDAVCFVLCLQNDKFDDMNYASGMRNYTIAIDSEGAIELVKYTGGASGDDSHEKKLAAAEEKSAELAAGVDFVPCKIELASASGGTEIKFSVGKTIAGKVVYTNFINYTDTENPYKGGRFALSTMNGSGLAVSDKSTDTDGYVQPPLPPFEAIKVSGVPLYEGSEPLSLFTGSDDAAATKAAFERDWSGRNGVFNYEVSASKHNGKYGISLVPDVNEEENGMIEFVGHYNKYIFDQVQYDITFAVDKLDDGWIMFWYKLLAKTQNVSAWGNKFTREGSQCYMTYLDMRGDLYFNKWIDWQQYFLGDSVNVRRSLDPQDVGVVKHIRMRIEYAKLDPESEGEYDSVAIDYSLVEGDREIPLRNYVDSKTPLLNPGFFGIQTLNGARLTIYDITATAL